MPANVMRAQRSATIVASAASSSSSSSSSSSAPTPQNRGRIIVPVAKKQLVGPSGAPLRGASAAASAVVAPDRAAPKDGPLVLNGQVSVIGGWESEGGRREREAFARTATTFNDETTPRPCPPPAKRTRAVDFFAARARPLLVPVLLFRSPVRPGTAEENRHGDLMNKYCYLSGRVNMKAVELTIQNLITSGMDPKTENNPYYGFIYT